MDSLDSSSIDSRWCPFIHCTILTWSTQTSWFNQTLLIQLVIFSFVCLVGRGRYAQDKQTSVFINRHSTTWDGVADAADAEDAAEDAADAGDADTDTDTAAAAAAAFVSS